MTIKATLKSLFEFPRNSVNVRAENGNFPEAQEAQNMEVQNMAVWSIHSNQVQG